MRRLLAAALIAFPSSVPTGLTAQESPPPIEDNSFLLEEAYNQEAGVVQHINALLRLRGSWSYAFTQEWPLGGQRHQLSYTVPIDGGLGDVALNYRHQLGGGIVALAPRLSVILPTGNADRGYGTGSVGFQLNLPVSATVAPTLVAHWNAGATVTPSNAAIYNAGASAIWLTRPTVNVMVELSWVGAGGGGGEELLLSPGLRWAQNVRGGLQIVPGIAYPIGLGPSAGARGVFLYLSFEHSFKSSVPAGAP